MSSRSGRVMRTSKAHRGCDASWDGAVGGQEGGAFPPAAHRGGRLAAKEGTVFRAFRTRVWGVTALLAGVLAPWGGQATAQPSRDGGSLSQPAASGNSRVAARSKLLQARAYLAQGNFDLADSLAREVESMGLAYAASEDSPPRVLEDIQKARTDPRALLQASRAALARQEFDLADRYASEADKRAGVFTFTSWGDTPAKVRMDISAARKSSIPGRGTPSSPPA